jgi:hypothetical protein
MAGFTTLKLQPGNVSTGLPAGTVVSMEHVETLLQDGSANNVYYPAEDHTGSGCSMHAWYAGAWSECANQTDAYISSGKAYRAGGSSTAAESSTESSTESYTPSFSYHGFRFVALRLSMASGMAGSSSAQHDENADETARVLQGWVPTKDTLTAHFAHSDLQRTGRVNMAAVDSPPVEHASLVESMARHEEAMVATRQQNKPKHFFQAEEEQGGEHNSSTKSSTTSSTNVTHDVLNRILQATVAAQRSQVQYTMHLTLHSYWMYTRRYNTLCTIHSTHTLSQLWSIHYTHTLSQLWSIHYTHTLSQLWSIPTDCPQREKRGWMGDAHMSSNGLMHAFDASSFHEAFLQSIQDDQSKGCSNTTHTTRHSPCSKPAEEAGSVPDVTPYSTGVVCIMYCTCHPIQVLTVLIPHTVLILYSYCTHTVLIPHTVPILYPYCTHTVLILYSYCTHTVLIPHRSLRRLPWVTSMAGSVCGHRTQHVPTLWQQCEHRAAEALHRLCGVDGVPTQVKYSMHYAPYTMPHSPYTIHYTASTIQHPLYSIH